MITPSLPTHEEMGHRDGFQWALPPLEGTTTASPLAIFPGRTNYGRLGRISYCQIEASAHIADRRPATRARDPRWLKLLFQRSGCSELIHARSRHELLCGSWVVYDPSQSYQILNQTAVDQLVLMIPRGDITRGRNLSVSDPVGSSNADASTCRILHALLASIYDELPHQQAHRGAEFGESILALIRAAISSAQEGVSPGSKRETLHERILSFINFNLAQPDLSADKIAASLGCSRRHIHRVFRHDGKSLNDYISSERLDRCRAELESQEFATKSITDIALTWGFNSSAYFSSVFRKKFGCSPRDMRITAVNANSIPA